MVYLQSRVVVTWLEPRETAAISARSVYTMQSCALSRHFTHSHIHVARHNDLRPVHPIRLVATHKNSTSKFSPKSTVHSLFCLCSCWIETGFQRASSFKGGYIDETLPPVVATNLAPYIRRCLDPVSYTHLTLPTRR